MSLKKSRKQWQKKRARAAGAARLGTQAVRGLADAVRPWALWAKVGSALQEEVVTVIPGNAQTPGIEQALEFAMELALAGPVSHGHLATACQAAHLTNPEQSAQVVSVLKSNGLLVSAGPSEAPSGRGDYLVLSDAGAALIGRLRGIKQTRQQLAELAALVARGGNP